MMFLNPPTAGNAYGHPVFLRFWNSRLFSVSFCGFNHGFPDGWTENAQPRVLYLSRHWTRCYSCSQSRKCPSDVQTALIPHSRGCSNSGGTRCQEIRCPQFFEGQLWFLQAFQNGKQQHHGNIDKEKCLMYPQGGYAAAVASFRWQRLRSIFCFWC